LPGFIHFKGSALIEDAANKSGEAWIAWIIIASGVLTSGAVIRVWARVFLGWGYAKETDSGQKTEKHEEKETTGPISTVLMYVPAVILLVLAFVSGWMAPFLDAVINHVPWIMNSDGYQASVLAQSHPFTSEHLAIPELKSATEHSLISFGLAFVLAWFGLSVWMQERSSLKKPFEKFGNALHSLHSGVACDYIAWFTAGVAIYTGYLIWG
jgi:multicomponent Na+:H+ antiporter subunit D